MTSVGPSERFGKIGKICKIGKIGKTGDFGCQTIIYVSFREF